MSAPKIKFASVTLDCPDQEALADFTQHSLDGKNGVLTLNGLQFCHQPVIFIYYFNKLTIMYRRYGQMSRANNSRWYILILQHLRPIKRR